MELCPVGAMAFYLAMRFDVTEEFKEFTMLNWLDNRSWFDIKLLVDASTPFVDRTKAMKNDTYSNGIKSVLETLGIRSNHWVHLGRVTGPKILEMVEVNADEIRRLGNWDPTIQEKFYSTKLPLGPMRAMAGFTDANGMYYNPRTDVKPPAELVAETPFAFAISKCERMEDLVKNEECPASTALHFLRFMKHLAEVFLQDAAAMWVLHEDRREHPLFHLQVFQHELWQVCFSCFCERMCVQKSLISLHPNFFA